MRIMIFRNSVAHMSDQYKCVKVPLHKIVIEPRSIEIIDDAVIRTNKIVIKAYQLVRLWIITKYKETESVPKIDQKTFALAIRVIQKKQKKCTDPLYLELQKLYEFEKEDNSNLTHVLARYTTIEMLTAFENNIKVHFFDYLRRFVNSVWKIHYKDELEKKTMKRSDLSKELAKVKNDLIREEETSDEKYHDWIEEVRAHILPAKSAKGHYYDLQAKPQTFLPCMIWMNLELEKIQGKMFQVCPLRNNIVPRFVQMDNKTIVDWLMPKSEKAKCNSNLTDLKQQIWTKLFHTKYIDHIKIKNYVFDYAFATDGYSASLRFIHVDELVKQVEKKKRLTEGVKKHAQLTKEERAIKKKNKLANEEKKKKDAIDKQEQQKKAAAARKEARLAKKKADQKSKEDSKQKNSTNTNKKPVVKKTTPPKKKTTNEFPYINEVSADKLEGNWVVVDPGKRDLLNMMNERGDHLIYSNRQRIKDCKRLKYQRLLQNHRNRLGVTKKETELSSLNSKSCDPDTFQKFVREKNRINSELFDSYRDKRFRQYRWYSYINKQRANQKMLDMITKKFGDDAIIIHGDWSQGQQMRHFMSTPNLGIKRKLRERFPVYNIDEFRSSKLHHQTEEECSNLKLPDTKGVMRKKHAVLTYKMETGRLGCINRDNNACRNLVKLMRYFIDTKGGRPDKYQRGSIHRVPPETTTKEIPTVPKSNGVMPNNVMSKKEPKK